MAKAGRGYGMTESDKKAFAEMMISLGEYYGKSVSQGLIGMYWQGLKHYDLSAVREALNRHVANPDTGQFMPKIADVSKMLTGTSSDKALNAWAKVDKAVRRVGPYASVAFDDPLIHRVLNDMGGWISLGTKTEDEWPFVAREFENRYRGFSMRGEVPDYPPVMVGLSEAHNRVNGHKVQLPMLIGNADKAKEVIALGNEKPMIGFTQATENAMAKVLSLAEAKETA